MDSILTEITKQGPLFTVLVAAVLYFKKEKGKKEEVIQSKEQAIQRLNDQLREADKENIQTLATVLEFLNKQEMKDENKHHELLFKLNQIIENGK